MLQQLVLKNRSYRKFFADVKVSEEALKSLIELARNTPSSKNIQPLKYILLTKKPDTDFVFDRLRWAWYLKNWSGPAEDERPPAYIIMLQDTHLNEMSLIDAGISAQTILLGAVEMGLGGCIIRSVNRHEVTQYFKLPDHLQIIQVIAIGKPRQEVKTTSIKANGKIEYFEDENDVHWVPKRKLDDIIVKVIT